VKRVSQKRKRGRETQRKFCLLHPLRLHKVLKQNTVNFAVLYRQNVAKVPLEPVLQPVVQPLRQPVVSRKRGIKITVVYSPQVLKRSTVISSATAIIQGGQKPGLLDTVGQKVVNAMFCP